MLVRFSTNSSVDRDDEYFMLVSPRAIRRGALSSNFLPREIMMQCF